MKLSCNRVSVSVSVEMEALSRIGVNADLKREDLVSSLLLSHSEDQLKAARTQLFEDAECMGLAHPKDILVKCMKRRNWPPTEEVCPRCCRTYLRYQG